LTDQRSSDADRPPRQKSVHRARKRGLSLLAILVAAASLVLVIGATADLDRHPPAVTPTAIPKGRPTASLTISQVLLQAGAAAGSQPGGWPEAPYWHSVSSYRQGSGPLVRREVWAGHEGIGSLLDARLSKDVIPLQDGRFAGIAWDELYALPSESRALESHLRARGLDGVRDADTELFALVGGLLRESPAPPALRKALWEVAARVPGTSLVGATTDSSGRSGVAIRRGDHGYVLDPKDGRLFEESIGAAQPSTVSQPSTAARPSTTSPGGVRWRATYLEQGPADDAPAPTPTGSGTAAKKS
jgi:hypothetical protein